MTAPEVVSGWPDEATAERVAEAIHDRKCIVPYAICVVHDKDRSRSDARAALSVLPDPTADQEIEWGVEMDVNSVTPIPESFVVLGPKGFGKPLRLFRRTVTRGEWVEISHEDAAALLAGGGG